MEPTISPEQRQALDARNGRPIIVVDPDRRQRFILIAESDIPTYDVLGPADVEGDWTTEKEARRRDLIDKDIAGNITIDERVELALLDRQGNAYYDAVAPRPLEGARRLHQDLLQKRDR